MAEFDGPDAGAESPASAYRNYAEMQGHGSGGPDQVPVPMSAIFRLSLPSTGICGCRSPPYSSFMIWCWWFSLLVVNPRISS